MIRIKNAQPWQVQQLQTHNRRISRISVQPNSREIFGRQIRAEGRKEPKRLSSLLYKIAQSSLLRKLAPLSIPSNWNLSFPKMGSLHKILARMLQMRSRGERLCAQRPRLCRTGNLTDMDKTGRKKLTANRIHHNAQTLSFPKWTWPRPILLVPSLIVALK